MWKSGSMILCAKWDHTLSWYWSDPSDLVRPSDLFSPEESLLNYFLKIRQQLDLACRRLWVFVCADVIMPDLEESGKKAPVRIHRFFFSCNAGLVQRHGRSTTGNCKDCVQISLEAKPKTKNKPTQPNQTQPKTNTHTRAKNRPGNTTREVCRLGETR